MAFEYPSRTRLLLSIRPRFAKEIISGRKQVELRRIRPAVGPGDEMVIYETSPTSAIVGRAIVEGVLAAKPDVLWKVIGSVSGVSQAEFAAYFRGTRLGYAIKLRTIDSLNTPISLRSLRKVAPGFAPPQSYHYLREERAMDRKVVAELLRAT